MHHLVGVTEIAEMLGLSRQRVHQLAADDPDFPAPTAVLRGGTIWERAAVERWARESGRPLSAQSPQDVRKKPS